MTTVEDADEISRVNERTNAYEQALRWIAVNGSGYDALFASRVLAENGVNVKTEK